MVAFDKKHANKRTECFVMTEKEKAAAGYLYNANYGEEILSDISKCNDLCHAFNQHTI